MEEKQLVNIIRSELENSKNSCRFGGCSEKDMDEMTYVKNVVAALGDGDIVKGVDVIKDNHTWLKKQRDRSDRISTIFIYILASAIVSGTLAMLWKGIQVFIGKEK